MIKAQTIANIVNKPVLADDSGLEVDALINNQEFIQLVLGHDTSYNIKNQYIIDAVKIKIKLLVLFVQWLLVIPG